MNEEVELFLAAMAAGGPDACLTATQARILLFLLDTEAAMAQHLWRAFSCKAYRSALETKRRNLSLSRPSKHWRNCNPAGTNETPFWYA